ncbi:Zn-ribbon domain-containing OB-fold protein [Falsiroseomonas tokyonensis]|uniref:Zn-ribbon domain-containing OB-fold protein n=1 Tax=Falsiroseomonas tokyonensis TaxID=430521 RepID=A0ABV7BW80_9PROT|nr:Zn-ribbon domain-containing OB-fold protein [Falsiroseomonas tokyonensis]MBU8539691.1 Zn-ribbon domain-containing OB-fold protein [Falsiroseomonas tokyonensis]
MSERIIAAPVIDPSTQSFWDAAREGRLMLGLCRDTGRHFFYPRGASPFTLSPNVELVPASGFGTIYSYTVMRVAEPYACAYVELAEGPRIFTNIVDCAFEDIRIGMKVRVVFKPTRDAEGAAGAPVPMFAPA